MIRNQVAARAAVSCCARTFNPIQVLGVVHSIQIDPTVGLYIYFEKLDYRFRGLPKTDVQGCIMADSKHAGTYLEILAISRHTVAITPLVLRSLVTRRARKLSPTFPAAGRVGAERG